MTAKTSHVVPATTAAIIYFAVVFAFGLVLGIVRILLLAPFSGATLAVLIEMPFMVAISWIACRWAVRRFAVPPHFSKRLGMGLLAFILLLSAEFLLAVSVFGQSPEYFFSELKTPPGIIGLLGQGLFALFPILQADIDLIRRATTSS